MAAQWLIAMGPIGWIIAAVAALAAVIFLNWDKIKKWTGQAWDWVWGKIQGIGRSILGYITNLPLVRFFLQHWEKIKTGTVNKVMGLLGYIRGLPGRIKSSLGNLGNLLLNAGRDIVMGLWNGIKSMGSWLKDTLVGWAKSMIPGPIADALGIASPSRFMAQHVGRWIPAGIVQGIETGQGEVDTTMRHLVNVPGLNKPRATGGGTCDHRMLLEWVGNDALKRAIRVVVVDGGGNVQEVLGN
jgi:phage-related protein